MTVTVSKATIIENIYKNFYDLVNAISGFSGIVYPSFNDLDITDESVYPIVIIDSPEIDWKSFTFGKGLAEGTISINVYTTVPKDTDEKSSDVSNQIETQKDTLAGIGLHEINMTSSPTDFAQHGSMKIYAKSPTFEFKFYYSKTAAF